MSRLQYKNRMEEYIKLSELHTQNQIPQNNQKNKIIPSYKSKLSFLQKHQNFQEIPLVSNKTPISHIEKLIKPDVYFHKEKILIANKDTTNKKEKLYPHAPPCSIAYYQPVTQRLNELNNNENNVKKLLKKYPNVSSTRKIPNNPNIIPNSQLYCHSALSNDKNKASSSQKNIINKSLTPSSRKCIGINSQNKAFRENKIKKNALQLLNKFEIAKKLYKIKGNIQQISRNKNILLRRNNPTSSRKKLLFNQENIQKNAKRIGDDELYSWIIKRYSAPKKLESGKQNKSALVISLKDIEESHNIINGKNKKDESDNSPSEDCMTVIENECDNDYSGIFKSLSHVKHQQ